MLFFQLLTAVMAVFTNGLVRVSNMIMDPAPIQFLLDTMPLASEFLLRSPLHMKAQEITGLYPFVDYAISAGRSDAPDELDDSFPHYPPAEITNTQESLG